MKATTTASRHPDVCQICKTLTPVRPGPRSSTDRGRLRTLPNALGNSLRAEFLSTYSGSFVRGGLAAALRWC